MIPKDWQNFCDEYNLSLGYWYIPKGLTIKEDNFPLIRERLKILKNFDGEDWSKVQHKFVSSIKKQGLFDRRVTGQSREDRAAIGRMFKVICSTLGIAWVNENENVAITDIGNAIIKSNSNEHFYKQINRFQFYNPSFQRKPDFTSIKVIPIPFIVELLLMLNEKELTKQEYILFVSRKKSMDDVSKTADEIEKYRKLSDDKKQSLIEYLDNVMIDSDNTRRTSIFNTIKLESPYALQFFGTSDYLSLGETLRLKKSIQESKKFIKDVSKNEVWIDFKTEKDWFYYYGKSVVSSSIQFALEYYADISDIENSSRLVQDGINKNFALPNFVLQPEYKSVMIDEKILEDFLEKHLDELEKGLKLVGRQYSTLTGPIDILAKDKQDKYVVIELKKGRTSDKVMGQTLRYIGYIQSNLSKNKPVRSIIIGRNIDNKLIMAAKGANIQCDLYEFDYKVSFTKIQYS